MQFSFFFFFSLSKLSGLTLKKTDFTGDLGSSQWSSLPCRIWILPPSCIAVPANPILHVPRRLFPVQFLLGSELLFFLLPFPSPSSCSEQLWGGLILPGKNSICWPVLGRELAIHTALHPMFLSSSFPFHSYLSFPFYSTALQTIVLPHFNLSTPPPA